MEGQKRICSLCLEVCNNLKTIEGDIKDVLNIFLPKIDLVTTQKPETCNECAELLLQCLDFKIKCFDAYDNKVTSANNKYTANGHLNKTENGSDVLEDYDICEFCKSSVKSYYSTSLNVEEGDVSLTNMIKQCLPELDLNIIKKLIICGSCHEFLVKFSHFMVNCLRVEEKIEEYCKTLGISNKDQIELSSLLRFTTRDEITSEVNGNLVDIIKVEKDFSEEEENCDEREIDNGHAIFKLEQTFFDNCEDVKDEPFIPIDMN